MPFGISSPSGVTPTMVYAVPLHTSGFRSPDHSWISAKPLMPGRVAQDGNWFRPVYVIFSLQRAAQRRVHSQDVKELTRYERAP